MLYKDYKEWLEVNKDLFKDHKIFNYKKDGNNWSFRFQSGIPDEKDNNRGNGWMNFQFNDGFLIITGDYGNAIFTWYNKETSLDWISNITSIGYFMEKCIANDLVERWDPELVRKNVQEYIKEYDLTIKDSWENHIDSKMDWISYLMNNADKFKDYECELYDTGVYTHPRVYVWKRALECANEYINKNHTGKKSLKEEINNLLTQDILERYDNDEYRDLSIIEDYMGELIEITEDDYQYLLHYFDKQVIDTYNIKVKKDYSLLKPYLRNAQMIHDLLMDWNDWGNYNFDIGDGFEICMSGYDEDLYEEDQNETIVDIVDQYGESIIQYCVTFDNEVITSTTYKEIVCDMLINYLQNR